MLPFGDGSDVMAVLAHQRARLLPAHAARPPLAFHPSHSVHLEGRPAAPLLNAAPGDLAAANARAAPRERVARRARPAARRPHQPPRIRWLHSDIERIQLQRGASAAAPASSSSTGASREHQRAAGSDVDGSVGDSGHHCRTDIDSTSTSDCSHCTSAGQHAWPAHDAHAVPTREQLASVDSERTEAVPGPLPLGAAQPLAVPADRSGSRYRTAAPPRALRATGGARHVRCCGCCCLFELHCRAAAGAVCAHPRMARRPDRRVRSAREPSVPSAIGSTTSQLRSTHDCNFQPKQPDAAAVVLCAKCSRWWRRWSVRWCSRRCEW